MSPSPPPPQLVFDDGSRIMAEEVVSEEDDSGLESSLPARGTTPASEFYELERIATELHGYHVEMCGKESYDGLRVALQFPDCMLCDAAEVCWELQDLLERKIRSQAGEEPLQVPLVFCLGDTTVGSCCPDEVAALHLDADVLVHYGHACLSPTGSLPVIYSFGFSPIDVSAAAEVIVPQIESTETKKVLLLYEVGYHHSMDELKSTINNQSDALVVMGQIPMPVDSNKEKEKENMIRLPQSCCEKDDAAGSEGCCRSNKFECDDELHSAQDDANVGNLVSEAGNDDEVKDENENADERIVLGGLEFRGADTCTWEMMSDMTILFIGDPRTSSRQHLHAMLRLLSLPDPPQHFWTYSPSDRSISTTLPVSMSRQLQRRFYLTERARTATTFGIVVSSLSQRHVVRLVQQLQGRIQESGKASYTFAVGKINPAKLANFGEIDCFVLVACSEQSLLEGERDYHVPIVTPLELSIALGYLSWGERVYSLDCNDVLSTNDVVAPVVDKDGGDMDAAADGSDDDSDAPFFSLISGKYEQRTKRSDENDINLNALPGKGQVTVYQSEAAQFLKNREYQGLQVQAGQTQVHIAKTGQRGIASGYEDNGSGNTK